MGGIYRVDKVDVEKSQMSEQMLEALKIKIYSCLCASGPFLAKQGGSSQPTKAIDSLWPSFRTMRRFLDVKATKIECYTSPGRCQCGTGKV